MMIDYMRGNKHPWAVRNSLWDILITFRTEAEAVAFIEGVRWSESHYQIRLPYGA